VSAAIEHMLDHAEKMRCAPLPMCVVDTAPKPVGIFILPIVLFIQDTVSTLVQALGK